MYDTKSPSAVDELGPLDFDTAQRLAGALREPVATGAEGAPDPTLPRIGDYVIDRAIGRGGAGTVYHAILPGWNDEFAIKVLHASVGEGRVARRAWRELDLAEQLDLPDTPRIYDYGVHEGRMFIVSRHVEGAPLDTYCEERGASRRDRVRLLARVARSVQSLHDRGVIHRDLKPDNILVDGEGRPVIIDLGIATLASEDLSETLTAAGAPVGSVLYMSPEQARGEREAASVRSDIYSLGATACRVLTGKTPHDVAGCSMLEALQRVGNRSARDPRELDPALPRPVLAILRKALAARPEDRFQTAAELAGELENWLNGLPVRAQRPSLGRNVWLSIRRQPGRWAVGAALFAAFAGLATFAGAAQADAWAEQEASARFKQEYEAIISQTSRDFVARRENQEYQQSLQLMRLLDDHLKAGGFDPTDEMLIEAWETVDAFTVDALASIQFEAAESGIPSELAMAAVRAIYEVNGTWSEGVGQEIERLMRDLD